MAKNQYDERSPQTAIAAWDQAVQSWRRIEPGPSPANLDGWIAALRLPNAEPIATYCDDALCALWHGFQSTPAEVSGLFS